MAENAPLYQIHQCQQCSLVLRRTHSPLAPPEHCGAPMKWRGTRTMVDPPPKKFGAAPGIDFRNTNPITLPIGDGISFESVHALRQFEKQSEQLAAEGIGQAYRSRGYSQDRSNMAVNTFGEAEQLKPDLTRTHKDGTPRVRVTSHEAPTLEDDAEMGPGAIEELASALPFEPT